MKTRQFLGRSIVLATMFGTLALCGCFGSSAGGTEGAEVANTHKDGSKLTKDDQAAADFVLSKIKEHWLKNADGWTTRYPLYNMLGQVMPGDPVILFHQYREFKYSIEPEPLTESLKLNGTDYRAGVTFERTPRRTYRTEQTYEGPQGWSVWAENWPSMMMAVERRNGKWIISDDDLWTGILPDAADVPAGK